MDQNLCVLKGAANITAPHWQTDDLRFGCEGIAKSAHTLRGTYFRHLMAEQIAIPPGASRKSAFEALIPQLRSLMHGEPNLIANLANVSAVLHQAFGWHWVGFYLVEGNELVLGPFQGPVACTRIARGKGVCGTAWATATTQVVPDVDLFEGHIACSPLSKSEIVIPLIRGVDEVWAVLDIDSTEKSDFSDADGQMLEELCAIISAHHFPA